ncbi:MAG TPA: hypothetical protein VK912_13990 [Longimicrobiales bacterium]|nr:hypothetical protein [Longimicrobiales bacterium]
MSTLIDDATRPPLRRRIGHLLARCAYAEIAVGHIRLAALDLAEDETRSVRRCRILLGRLEVRALTDFGFTDPDVEKRMAALLAFLESGRVEIRSAGLGAWSPDFSTYRRPDGAECACLVGAHYFREPPSPNGPSLTALLTDPYSVALALARFETLWARGHDVLEPVVSAVHKRQSFSGS